MLPTVAQFLKSNLGWDDEQSAPPDEISAPVTPVDSSQWDAASVPTAGAGGQSWAPPIEDTRAVDEGPRETGPAPFTPISPNTPEPTYEIADGRTAPPTPNGTWEEVRTIPKPQPVAEQSQQDEGWLPRTARNVGNTIGEAATAGGKAWLESVTSMPSVAEMVQAPYFDPIMGQSVRAGQAAQAAASDVIGRRFFQGVGGNVDEELIEVNIPGVGPVKLTKGDVAGLLFQMGLDPSNIVGAGQAPNVARAAAPVVREAGQAAGRAGRALAEEAAQRGRGMLDNAPRAGGAPGEVQLGSGFVPQRGGADDAIRTGRGRREGQQRLTVQEMTGKGAQTDAFDYIDGTHRHNAAPQGDKSRWEVIGEDGQRHGVATAGRPNSRMLDDGVTLEVTRVATDGTPNAVSALYGAVRRAAPKMDARTKAERAAGVSPRGYQRLVTFTLDSEPGTSLRASGWTPVAVTADQSWNRPGRPRADVAPAGRKIRWEMDLTGKTPPLESKEALAILERVRQSRMTPDVSGSGLTPGMSDIRNAAQGGVVGAMSEQMTDEELTPEERLRRIGAGTALGVAAGRFARGRGAGTARRLGSGMVPERAPESPVSIPRAGRAAPSLSSGAEDAVRAESLMNAPRERMDMEDIAQRAEEVLGVKPDEVRAWQQANAAEPEYARAVRGQALRQAEYNDAESVSRALDRLEAAQIKAREAGDITNLSDVDRLELADATLEAAQARQALQTSAAASTAEGRATARALAQRRQAIVARQGVVSAERARQLGQDAAFAERAIQQAVTRGTVTPQAEQRLRILVEKLRDAERNGLLAEDGVGGRLLATEASAAQGSTRPGMRAVESLPRTPLLTTLASDIGSGLAGGIAGAVTAGATNPDDPNAINVGVAGGAVLGILGRRALGRTRPGALATFGFAPTPQNPQRAIAMGADPSRRYEFRYRVVDLNNLTASHGPTGAPNPAFPQELQPRDRGRAGSMQQVDRIARGLSPDALLYDAGRLDSGPMIVGPDLIVESGNGRTLALRRAADQYPEQYQQYVDALRQNLGEYGLDEQALQGMQRPVLVRERLSNVDRAAFAAEANNAGLLQMSAFERAAQDAGNLSDEMVSSIIVGDNDTIASALKRTENRDLIRQWVGTLPPNEQAGVIDASGNLSAQGYERIANALLMRTYGEGAGTRLVQAFVESADPTVRNVQTALMASLPDVARAEAMIRNGTREAGLSIAEDVAAAVDMLARLKREGMRVDEYLRQSAMFERELTPTQEQILSFMDRNVRRQNAIRDTLKEYALRVENSADPNQMGMFGAEVAPVGKDDAWRSAAATVERQSAENQAARRARANGAGLAGRADPADIIPATGGPEGSLAVEGQPAAVTRPGPLPENVAPVGGPEGSLAVENAPLRAANLPPVADNALPAGGPEARLMREGAPPEPARLAPVGDLSTGGPEGRLQAPPTSTPAEMRALEASRIRGVVSMIDEVLANPQAPDAIARLQQLQTDLGEISKAGFTRASDIRRRLQRNGLLRAGLASKTEDVDGLVQALARVDPSRPEEMRAVLNIISKPRLIDKILEYQYVNMLSSPITQSVNVSSNVMQLAGRLLLQNPLEFAYSGGKSTGVGAAFSGAKRGFSEALPEVGQIMRTGISSKSMERAAELGDYGHINREALTEQFGKAGAALHFISTRPLQAMDALLGHMAYASAAEQLAQRKADRLLRANTPSVQGMSREQARQYVMANIWDHTDIIEKAGKISDYTLLKSNDASGTAWANRAERTLRQIGSLGRPSESAGIGEQMLAFMVNQVMPFVGVPLNFAKQGIERTAGVPINAGRAALAARRGEGERAAELAAKATIGAGALTAGAMFALTDNLTDDGPSNPGQREIWLQTHKPNSFRIPGTASWISWEGTPFAIPFGMIAGAQRGWQEAQERATKKGMTDPADLYGSAALKAGQGAVAGFASQSFVKSLGQQYQLLTGDQTGLGAVAASAAGTASRFMPAGSMVNFLARIGDTVERDPGKPQSASEIPQNIVDRMATRVPGARQTVNSRLGPYGEAMPNEQQGVMGALPYYRGQGAMAGDAITKKVEEAKVGAPQAPAEITFRGMTISLERDEQRTFKEVWGKAFRRELEAMQRSGKGYPPDAYAQARQNARDEAEGAILKQIGPSEIRRRVEGRAAGGAR